MFHQAYVARRDLHATVTGIVDSERRIHPKRLEIGFRPGDDAPCRMVILDPGTRTGDHRGRQRPRRRTGARDTLPVAMEYSATADAALPAVSSGG